MLPDLEQKIILLEADPTIKNAQTIISAISALKASIADVSTRVAKY